MAVDEAARHRLHTKLEEILGTKEAAALMTYLPPVGWADVARKRDLDVLAEKIDLKTDQIRSELRSEMERLARRLVMWMSSMIVAAVGLAFVVGRLT